MKTPPSTRTRDDANMELHEIELLINAENAKLEVVSQKRKEAEDGFMAREKRCEDRENACERIIKHADIQIESRSNELKSIESEIYDRCQYKLDLLETIKQEEQNYIDAVDKRGQKIKNLDSSVHMLETNIQLLKEKKAKDDAYILSLVGEIDALQTEINELSTVKEKESKEIDANRAKIDEEGRILESKKSDIRILSVRFHNKYGDVLTEGQRVSTTVN